MAYEFGSKHGLLVYSYPEDRRPDSKSDIMTFGFITVQENAQLIRVTSASSTDFLELTLVFIIYFFLIKINQSVG